MSSPSGPDPKDMSDKPDAAGPAAPEREDVLESFEVADGDAGDLDLPGRFSGSTRADALANLQVDAAWQPRANTPEELAELVERLPDLPGVYLMRDRKGDVVYIGKARRLRARVRRGSGTEPVHTLNGTAVAVGRTIIALLENHQREDGSVALPAALRAHGAPEEIRPR